MLDWMTILRATLCHAYRKSGALAVHEAIARYAGRRFVAVLVFHRVADIEPADTYLTVNTKMFRGVCKMLSKRFNVLPLSEVYRLLRSGEDMPPRSVAITFDDCYKDNLPAARQLAEHGLPATFFVPTAYVGTDHVFAWDRHLPQMPNLTWDDVREMSRMGFDIGSHTVTHANLGEVDADQAWSEMTVSREVIQKEVGKEARFFAYPYGFRGHLREEYIPLILKAGYEGAVSAYGGFVRPGMDDRVLPRVAVPPFRSLDHFEVFLTDSLQWLYALKDLKLEQPDEIIGRAGRPLLEVSRSGSVVSTQ